MTQLFDTENPASGFRLMRMELFNWGTFDRKIWKICPEGNLSLLTGGNGSGKTTLVDALLTLLVPAGKRHYNQSSGADRKRERTEKSYVLGAYKKTREEDRLSAEVNFLRDNDDFSLILGVFCNRDTGESLSLAQFRCFSNHDLKRWFIIAPSQLSIQEHFGSIDPEGKWRKRLAADCKAEFHTQFAPYQRRFSRAFGLKSEKALALFSQTAGIKEMDNLDTFIRNHMLEENNVEEMFRKLIDHSRNLEESYRSIQKAGMQLELLKPVMDVGNRYTDQKEKLVHLEYLKTISVPWFAGEKTDLLTKAMAEGRIVLERLQAQMVTVENEIEARRRKRRELEAVISSNAVSVRLREIQKDMDRLGKEAHARQERMEAYNGLARKMGFPENPDQSCFLATIERMKDRKAEVDAEEKRLLEQWRALQNRLESAKKSHQEAVDELASLRKRKNNIPDANLRIRKMITDHLGLRESDMPFPGELIRVRESERLWENAIERLLHNFALCILIPKDHYAEVNRFVNGTDLRGRVIYHLIQNHPKEEMFDRRPTEKALLNKLELKSKDLFCLWIEQRIKERFDYICTDDLAEFRRMPKAMTAEGLTKNEDRHEKDDRPGIKERPRYVLGWDNARKIRMIKQAAADLDAQIRQSEKEIQANNSARKMQEDQKDVLSRLSYYQSFSDLDWQSPRMEIEELKAEKQKLEESSDQLRALQEEKDRIEGEIGRKTGERNDLQKQINRSELTIENHEKEYKINAEILSEYPEPDLDGAADHLLPYIRKTGRRATLENIDCIEKAVKADIDREYSEELRKVKRAEKELTRHMENFKHPEEKIRSAFPDWKAEAHHLSVEAADLSEYKSFFESVEKDDLPRYRERFKEYLNKQAIDDIVDFKTALENQVSEIERAIGEINSSLKAIDYSTAPRTYLRLTSKDAQDKAIKDFKGMTREAIPNQYHLVRERDQEIEAAYHKIRELIEKMKSDDGWRRHVTDTRNWLRFSAEERYRDGDEQKCFYEDSQSLSGGQKSKLAYTVLASAIAYQFGIRQKRFTPRSLRFVVVDEAFSKVDPDNAVFAMELFKQLNLQVMVVTPMDKISVAEKYIRAVHYVQNKHDRDSEVFNMTLSEYRDRKDAFLQGVLLTAEN